MNASPEAAGRDGGPEILVDAKDGIGRIAFNRQAQSPWP